MSVWMDGRTDGGMDGWMDGCMGLRFSKVIARKPIACIPIPEI